jgi:hypothetical protein
MAVRSDPGHGRGLHTSWRFNALPPPAGVAGVERDLDDTNTSPVKNSHMEVEDGSHVEALAKRRLNMVFDEDALEDNLANDHNAMRLDGAIIPSEVLVDVVKKDRMNRPKKDGANSPSQGSTTSHEESIRL